MNLNHFVSFFFYIQKKKKKKNEKKKIKQTISKNEFIDRFSEVKIIENFEQRNFPFRKEYLDLGDFIIQDSNQQELIIERKTWNDLQCSLKDQRYREQRSRLLLYEKNNNNVKICYILEGSNSDYEIEKKKLFFV